ncbi:MAG: nucleotidyltransferase domain-containing protein [Thermomicrobiales bacterium]|nr:nucleotidyltransferase domain-containing protein [Thermomicrobiales bacterium]
MSVTTLVERVARVPGVRAVTLGGSRARGMARPDSDWDFGLYYRGRIDTDAIRALGYPGQVVEPGAWGRIVNGGAWLEVEGERVDLLYRDLDVVEHWVAESNAGRFEIDHVGGHVAGLPTYTLAGELALGTVLRGNVPRPAFTAELRRSAPPRWEGEAAFSLLVAEQHARRGDATGVAGLLARAVLASAHARLASRGAWALNEKGIIARAGLEEAGEILTAVGWTPRRLEDAIAHMRDALRLRKPEGLAFDAVVRDSPLPPVDLPPPPGRFAI